MEAEKYKLETEKAQANLNSFKEEVLGIEKEISLAKEERAQCRMDLGKDEGVDRDTNVHLDMKVNAQSIRVDMTLSWNEPEVTFCVFWEI